MVKSYLDGDLEITLKHNLYRNNRDEKYMPITIIVENGTFDAGELVGVWFLKPSDQFTGAGTDIYVFNSPTHNDINTVIAKYPIWVLQQEVYNRMILHDSYFIVRYYCSIVYDVSSFYVYGMNIGRIILHDRDEPISQLKKVGARILIKNKIYHTTMQFDMDFDDYFDKFHAVARNVIETIANGLHGSGSIGYNVYGFDFIVQNTGEIKLLEVNDHAQLSFKEEEGTEENMSYIILNTVMTKIEDVIVRQQSDSAYATLLLTHNFMGMQTRMVRHFN
jgi:hypothetical protein